MRARIVGAVFGLTFAVAVLCLYETLILNFSVGFVCFFMIYEMFRVLKIKEKSMSLFVVSGIYAAIFSFLKFKGLPDFRLVLLFLYLVFIALTLLKKSDIFRVESLTFCSGFTVVVSFAVSIVIYMRDEFLPYGLYYIMLTFVVAWVCDAGAYFVGRKFGKTKLAFKVSPKKTVEGAVGGIISSVVAVYIFNLIYFSFAGWPVKINFLRLTVLVIFGALLSILGDLVMSAIKRQNGAKDFGNVILGHGGFLDRFDSWIFVAVAFYFVVKNFPIVL